VWARIAAVGMIAIPEMERRGYARPLIFGSLAAGGTLGILIPPSIPMIIYGVMTETSIGRRTWAERTSSTRNKKYGGRG
jgi:C4-dicarboxylate transporter, DctM subunit